MTFEEFWQSQSKAGAFNDQSYPAVMKQKEVLRKYFETGYRYALEVLSDSFIYNVKHPFFRTDTLDVHCGLCKKSSYDAIHKM